jgi:hypothetical protein
MTAATSDPPATAPPVAGGSAPDYLPVAQAAGMAAGAVLTALGSGEAGLSEAAAAQRRERLGANVVRTHRVSVLTVLARQTGRARRRA